MQLLWITTLLLSAVAARRGDDDLLMTQIPEDGDEGSGGGSSHPVLDLPPCHPNKPGRRPSNGNPWGPMRGNGCRPERPGFPIRGKRQVPGVMPRGPRFGPSRPFGRPVGPPRGDGLPFSMNPSSVVFSPIFKVDNVTFSNVTSVTLTEGENVFMMSKSGGSGHHHHHHRHHHHAGGKHGPSGNMQYVKLIYNATRPNEVSVEYGVLNCTEAAFPKGSLSMKLWDIFGVDNNRE
nr:uncharacterized protein LOC124072944 isoform X2 [Scatophagus argus]